MKNSLSIRKMTTMAILCAMSVVLTFMIRIPFPPATFLEFDLGDIPLVIGTLMFGPLAGVIIALINSIIQGITVSSGSGIIGIVMHFIASGTMALVIGAINKKLTFSTRSYVAVVSGGLSRALIMIPLNLIFTPIFMGTPVEQVLQMIVPIIIPFNLINAGINILVGVHIYCGIYFAMHKFSSWVDK